MNRFILDVRTLTLVLTLVSAVLSLLMLFIWKTSKTYRGFGLWTLGNAVGAISFLLLGLRDVAPDFFTVVLSNALIVTCLILSLEGIKRFFGRRASLAPAAVILLLNAVIQSYFTYIYPGVTARVYITSALTAFFGAWCAYEFTAVKKNRRRVTTALGALIFGTFAVVMLARVGLTYLFANVEDFQSPEWIQSLTFVMLILLETVGTINFIMLNGERTQDELKTAQVELEKLATTDFLTGVSNSRSFTQISEAEIRRAARFGEPLSLIMFDIDDFKSVNDTYGHGTGDMVLKVIADASKSCLRTIDVIGRLGGEEFGILLPHTDLAGATTVAENVRAEIEGTEIKASSGVIKMALSVTASFGVSSLDHSDSDVKALLNRADAHLYEAKRAGRNCVKFGASDKKFVNLRLAPPPAPAFPVAQAESIN